MLIDHKTNIKIVIKMKKEIIKSIPWIVVLLIFASYMIGAFIGDMGIELPFFK